MNHTEWLRKEVLRLEKRVADLLIEREELRITLSHYVRKGMRPTEVPPKAVIQQEAMRVALELIRGSGNAG